MSNFFKAWYFSNFVTFYLVFKVNFEAGSAAFTGISSLEIQRFKKLHFEF